MSISGGNNQTGVLQSGCTCGQSNLPCPMHNPSGYNIYPYPPAPKVCPTCGTCPTCGARKP